MARQYREQEHPRWPAGSPGGRGGEWRPRTGGWAAAVADRMGFSPRDELIHTVKNGLRVDQADLMAGGNSSSTRIVDFEMSGGEIRRLVYKKMETRGEATTEQSVSILAEAIGAPVVPAFRDPTNPTAIWMPLIRGRSPMELLVTDFHGGAGTFAEIYYDREDMYFEAIESDRYKLGLAGLIHLTVDTDEGRLLGLLDMLTRNTDRHEGNWMITDDGFFGIDHTHVSTNEVVTEDIVSSIYWTDSPFAHHFMWKPGPPPEEGYGGVPYEGLPDNDMHPDDMALIEQRIKAMYAPGGAFQFGVGAGTPMSQESLLSKLRVLAARAKGTRRRLS